MACMDDNTIRVAIGLRLSVQITLAEVDYSWTRLPLEWRSSPSHIVHRALSNAKIPARLEPSVVRWEASRRHHRGAVEVWEAASIYGMLVYGMQRALTHLPHPTPGMQPEERPSTRAFGPSLREWARALRNWGPPTTYCKDCRLRCSAGIQLHDGHHRLF